MMASHTNLYRLFGVMYLLPLLAIFGCLIEFNDAKSDRVKLKDIQVLTLRKGHKTTARRSKPLHQLMCIGGTARCSYLPETVQCYNRGWDGRTVNWECKAEMEKKYSFGELEVSCEGYDHSDDSYVLAGSCALEYTINLVDGTYYKPSYQPPPPGVRNIQETSSESSFLAIAVFIVLAFLLYIFCARPIRPNVEPTAPPPPGFMPGYADSPPNYYQSTYTRSGSCGPDNENSGPGFGAGLATGGVLGYLFGRNSAQSSSPPTYTSFQPNPSYSSSSQDLPSTTSGRDSSPTRMASGFATTKRR